MSAECIAENITRGYKQTEVGVIPDDWEVLSLSEISKRITDGEHLTPRRSNSGYYLLSARNILNGRINLLEVDYVGEIEYRRIRQRCNPEAGDVLISCSGTIGRVAIVPKGLECVMVRSAALIKPDAEKLSGLYAQYFLQFSAGQKQIFASLNQGAQANLFLNHIQGLRVALPPTKAEQEAIAEALSDTDAFIESLEQLIAKKRQIKQGAMQELLTGKRRIPKFVIKNGYKHAEAGTIPEDWSSICYADYLNILSGLGFKKAEYCDIGIRLLRIDNVSYGKISWDSVVYLPLQYTEKFPNLVLSEGDILLALNRPVTNNQLKLARLNAEDSPAILYQRVGKIEVINSKLDKTFAYFILRKFIRKFVEESSVGSDQPFVSTTALKKIHIPLPPTLAEQEAIATILFDMDSEITALEEKLAKARQIKQGIMQELLTGRIRLI